MVTSLATSCVCATRGNHCYYCFVFVLLFIISKHLQRGRKNILIFVAILYFKKTSRKLCTFFIKKNNNKHDYCSCCSSSLKPATKISMVYPSFWQKEEVSASRLSVYLPGEGPWSCKWLHQPLHAATTNHHPADWRWNIDASNTRFPSIWTCEKICKCAGTILCFLELYQSNFIAFWGLHLTFHFSCDRLEIVCAVQHLVDLNIWRLYVCQ